MKKVSVIMPTYKGERMLRKAIQSILSQTYSNLELIIIDDNGLDTDHQKRTEAIVKDINDGRIIYVAHKNNQNGACARNTGLSLAQGDFICFHDDDDLMLPDRIEACVDVLTENSEFDGVLMDVLCCDEKMTPTRLVRVRKNGDCTRDLFMDGMFLGSGSNIFVTRKVAEKIGNFDANFARHQDVEYMIRFYRFAKSKSIGKIGIIKSKNNTNNMPAYPRFKENEDYFIEKFKDEIDHLSESDRKKFFSDVSYWLKLSKALYCGDTHGLNIRGKLLVFIMKTNFNKNPLFLAISRLVRKRKVAKLGIPNSITVFLRRYR